MFNALEIRLDTFHCLKIRNKTKQIPQRKNQQASKEQEKKGMKKKFMCTEYTVQTTTHLKDEYHQVRKINNLSNNDEKIISWG